MGIGKDYYLCALAHWARIQNYINIFLCVVCVVPGDGYYNKPHGDLYPRPTFYNTCGHKIILTNRIVTIYP